MDVCEKVDREGKGLSHTDDIRKCFPEWFNTLADAYMSQRQGKTESELATTTQQASGQSGRRESSQQRSSIKRNEGNTENLIRPLRLIRDGADGGKIFDPVYPAAPGCFADREVEIERFRKALANTLESDPPRPENIAVLGNWGVGKTSMLNKMRQLAEQQSKKTLAITIPVPHSIADMGEFIRLVLDTIVENVKLKESLSDRIREEIFGWKIKQLQFMGIILEGTTYRETYTTPTSLLRSSLVDLWREHLRKEDVQAVLLLLDDVHHLVRAVKGAIYDLRAVFQDLPNYGCNYQLILTGPKDLFSEIRELAEPLTRFFEFIHLESFDLAGTRDAVTSPLHKAGLQLTVAEEVIKTIHERTRGHPYFIAFIMRDLLNNKRVGVITPGDFNGLYPSIFDHICKLKFEGDFESASEKERDLLLQAASLGEEIITRQRMKGHFPRVTYARLVAKQLLVRLDRGRFMIYHPLFRQYLHTLSSGSENFSDRR